MKRKTSRHFPTESITLYADNQRSEHTARNAGYRLRAFARWLESEYRVTELERVKTEHILGYKKRLAASGLAASSQSRAVETLRGFFRWCFAEHLIERDPAAQVKAPRPLLNKEPEYLTTDESRRLIDSIDTASQYGARDLAAVWCLSYGLRVGEVAGLNCGDVLAPDKARKLPGLRCVGKGTRQRIIPICEAAYNAVRAYMTSKADGAPTAPLFTAVYHSEPGRMTTRAIQKRFALSCVRAGIDESKRHPHVCRHAAAQRWLFESNANIFTVSKMLGHGSIATTEKYLHTRREAMESAVLADPLARA